MAKRIGVHLGTAGGASNAVERAKQIGANIFQIFSSSPRMCRAPKVHPEQAKHIRELAEDETVQIAQWCSPGIIATK